MGCSHSKHGKIPSKDMDISWPTSCHLNSGPLPFTFCKDCLLPSRQFCYLTDPLASSKIAQFCKCNEQAYQHRMSLPRYTPDAHQFNFDFKESPIEEVEAIELRARSIDFMEQEQNVEVVELESSQSTSTTAVHSIELLHNYDPDSDSDAESYFENGYDEDELIKFSNLEKESFGPRLRIMGRLPFTLMEKDTAEAGVASAREKLPTRTHVKVVRVWGRKIEEML